MKLTEIAAEQLKPIEQKLQITIMEIQRGINASKTNLSIAFSGGKDSVVLTHIIKTYFPEVFSRIYLIFGNTGVEYPESLAFARQLGKEWAGDRFIEARPARTTASGYKYAAQREILDYLIQTDTVRSVLKADGKLRTTQALERACPQHLREKFEQQRMIWPEGTQKSFFWCVDQYGWPIMGKAFSKLKARRINIDCFLKFSTTSSEDPKLKAYYDVLREVKISQACCDILKKEPSKRIQKEKDIDVVFLGMMASESRRRLLTFASNGYLYEYEDHVNGHPVYACNPMSIWTDEDVWEYIERHNAPSPPLYSMGYNDDDGNFHNIKRNGCLGCCTDLLFPNNHMSLLRRTHPKAWSTFMRLGMAEELRKLQQARRNGQISLMDYLPVEHLIENRPCAFDSINKLILPEDGWGEVEDAET